MKQDLIHIVRDLIEAIRENTDESRKLRRDLLRQILQGDAALDREDVALVLGISVSEVDRLGGDPASALRKSKLGRRTLYRVQAVRDLVRSLPIDGEAPKRRSKHRPSAPSTPCRDERDVELNFDFSDL